MVHCLHKALACFGAFVLIVCTAWGGASLGTRLVEWSYPDRVNVEWKLPGTADSTAEGAELWATKKPACPD
jgi:hypothetical protein